LPFVQGESPMHQHHPTPRRLALHRAERLTAGSGSSLGLFWDFRLRQQVRA
jgi:hypothetical protein